MGVESKKFDLLYGEKKVSVMEENFKRVLTIKES
jgi:hypothetical protein